MGAYIYSLRSKTVKIFVEGEEVEAGLLKYSHKPYSCIGSKEPRWQVLANARIARQQNIWNDRGYTPRYVVVVGDDNKPERGCLVLDWHSFKKAWDSTEYQYYDRMAVSTYDDPDWGGRKSLGRLNGSCQEVLTNKEYELTYPRDMR